MKPLGQLASCPFSHKQPLLPEELDEELPEELDEDTPEELPPEDPPLEELLEEEPLEEGHVAGVQPELLTPEQH